MKPDHTRHTNAAQVRTKRNHSLIGLQTHHGNYASRNRTPGDSAGRRRYHIHPKVESGRLPSKWRELTLQQNPGRTLLQPGPSDRWERQNRQPAIFRRHIRAIRRPRRHPPQWRYNAVRFRPIHRSACRQYWLLLGLSGRYWSLDPLFPLLQHQSMPEHEQRAPQARHCHRRLRGA